jgi:hypothetical protein
MQRKKHMYLKSHRSSKFKVGDKVKILRIAKELEQGWEGTTYARDYVGKVGLIARDLNEKGFVIQFEDKYQAVAPWFTVNVPWFVLELYDKSKNNIPLSANDYLVQHKQSGIKEGDTVRVIRKATDFEQGWQAVWDPAMSELLGKNGRVIKDGGEEGFSITFSNKPTTSTNCYTFPWFVLEKIN